MDSLWDGARSKNFGELKGLFTPTPSLSPFPLYHSLFLSWFTKTFMGLKLQKLEKAYGEWKPLPGRHFWISITWPMTICHFLSVVLWNRTSISNDFRDICIQYYMGQDHDLCGSHDVIEHVTIWYPWCHFLWVLHCNPFCISSRFRDNGAHTFWGHDLDLSRSRDVIAHMTSWFAMCHFLSVVHWNRANCFRDIRPNKC